MDGCGTHDMPFGYFPDKNLSMQDLLCCELNYAKSFQKSFGRFDIGNISKLYNILGLQHGLFKVKYLNISKVKGGFRESHKIIRY